MGRAGTPIPFPFQSVILISKLTFQLRGPTCRSHYNEFLCEQWKGTHHPLKRLLAERKVCDSEGNLRMTRAGMSGTDSGQADSSHHQGHSEKPRGCCPQCCSPSRSASAIWAHTGTVLSGPLVVGWDHGKSSRRCFLSRNQTTSSQR